MEYLVVLATATMIAFYAVHHCTLPAGDMVVPEARQLVPPRES
jgi:hypothetical protein